MPLLIAIGVVVVLFAMIVCTQRVEDFWKTRSKKIKTLSQTSPHVVPPFIYSATQCRDCGIDGDLLNLEHRCLDCHEVAHGG